MTNRHCAISPTDFIVVLLNNTYMLPAYHKQNKKTAVEYNSTVNSLLISDV